MPPIREHTILYTFPGDEDDEEEDVDGEEDPDMGIPPLIDAAALPYTDTARAPPPLESMMSSFEFRLSPGAAFGSPLAVTLVYPPHSSFNTEGGVDGAGGGNTAMGGRRRGALPAARPTGYPSPTTVSGGGGTYRARLTRSSSSVRISSRARSSRARRGQPQQSQQNYRCIVFFSLCIMASASTAAICRIVPRASTHAHQSVGGRGWPQHLYHVATRCMAYGMVARAHIPSRGPCAHLSRSMYV
ncbi:hypothetical protein C8J57DRAFT_106866 [Mycena rebaudengoi]|nr:hypothetical protein C8J57DRAFT_106866 [Mycena rebaudengoi]